MRHLRCHLTARPLLFLPLSALLLAGCGVQSPSVPVANPATPIIRGVVHGGQQPVTGSTIQLWTVGTASAGSAATTMISKSVVTDAYGNFNIGGDYTCPTSGNPLVYITATNGNPGLTSGTNNTHLALVALLGACSTLGASTVVTINEVTTVGAAMGLAGYMSSYSGVGSSSTHVSELTTRFNTAAELVNTITGTAGGTGIPSGSAVDVALINTLADILATCVNSAGGVSGDGSPCGNLFALTGGSATTDTSRAIVYMAANPTTNLTNIFNLLGANPPFQPTYTSAPSSFAVAVEPQVATPTISPNGGTINVATSVSLADTTSGSAIYYTTDGTTPTTSSNLYSTAFSVASTETVNAIATLSGDVNSNVGSATFTYQPIVPPNQTLTSGSNTLTFFWQTNDGYSAAGYGVTIASPSVANTAITQTPVQIFTCGGTAINNTTSTPAMCDGNLNNDPPLPNTTTGDVVNYAVPYSSVTLSNGAYTASATITTTAGSVFTITDLYTAVPNTTRFNMNRNVSVVPAATNPEIGFNSEYGLSFQAPTPITSDHVFAPAIWYDKNLKGSVDAYSAGDANTAEDYFLWGETWSPMPVVMLQDPTGDVLALGHTGPGTYGPQVSSPLPPACLSSFTNPCPNGTPNYDADNNNWLVQPDAQYGSLGLTRPCTGACTNPPDYVTFIYPQFMINVSANTGNRQAWNRRSHPVLAGVTHNYTLTLSLEQDSLAGSSPTSADFPTALQNTWRGYLPFYNTPIPLLPSNNPTDGNGNPVDVSYLAYQDGISLITNQTEELYWFDQTNSHIQGVNYGFPDVHEINDTAGIADAQNGETNTQPSWGSQMGFTGKSLILAYLIYRDGLLSSTNNQFPLSGNTANQALGLGALKFWGYTEPNYEANNGYTTGLPLDWYHENSSLNGGNWDPGTCPNYTTNPNAAPPILLVKEMDALPYAVDAAVLARQNNNKQDNLENFLSAAASFLVTAQNTDGSYYRGYDAMAGTVCSTDTQDSATDTLQTPFVIQFLVKMYFATGNTAYSAAAIKAATWMVNNNFANYFFVGGIPTIDVQDRNAGPFIMNAALAMYDLATYQLTVGANTTGQTPAAWTNYAAIAATYDETWQYVWNFKFNSNAPALTNASPLHVSMDREGGSGAGGIGESAEVFAFYRLHLLLENSPSGHFAQWATMVNYNTKLTTEMKGVTVTAYGKTYNEDFNYPLNGSISEAATMGDMNAYGPLAGWHGWLTSSSLESLVNLDAMFGDYSIYNLNNNQSITAQQQLNVVTPAFISTWGN